MHGAGAGGDGGGLVVVTSLMDGLEFQNAFLYSYSIYT